MIGIMEFLKEHDYLLEDCMNMRAVYIRKLFSNIAGYKRLEYLDKTFFKSELTKRLDVISRKITHEEIQNNKNCLTKHFGIAIEII